MIRRRVVYRGVCGLYDEDGDLWALGVAEVPVERFKVRRIASNLWNGFVRYRYPWCCVLAYVWWEFWHGAPFHRFEQRYGIEERIGGDTGFEPNRKVYVPCHRHCRRLKPDAWIVVSD